MTSILQQEDIETLYEAEFETFPLTPPRISQPMLRRWTVKEYYRAAEVGIFHPDERLELIDGEVWRKVSPQNWRHSATVTNVAEVMRKVFAGKFFVQEEKPISVSARSEPEPDVAVYRGSPRDYKSHPQGIDAVLLIEISDSTTHVDKKIKPSLHASANVQEYWILDVQKQVIEVRRNPQETPGAQFGYDYSEVKTYAEPESVTALAAPERPILVKDLLLDASMLSAEAESDSSE